MNLGKVDVVEDAAYCDNSLAVRQEGEAAGSAVEVDVMPEALTGADRKDALLLQSPEVPGAHGSVAAPGSEPLAVAGKRDGPDRVLVALQGHGRLARRRVPKANGAGATGRRQRLAVRRE